MPQRAIRRLRKRAFEAQGGKCYWCSEPMIFKTQENAANVWNHPRVCTADHLTLQAHGGETSRRNIVAACRECNNARHDSVPMLDGTKPTVDFPRVVLWEPDRLWLQAP